MAPLDLCFVFCMPVPENLLVFPVTHAVKPSGSRSDLNAGEPGWSAHKGDSVAGAKVTIAPSALTSSQIMNTSMTSTSSELSLLARRQQVRQHLTDLNMQ